MTWILFHGDGNRLIIFYIFMVHTFLGREKLRKSFLFSFHNLTSGTRSLKVYYLMSHFLCRCGKSDIKSCHQSQVSFCFWISSRDEIIYCLRSIHCFTWGCSPRPEFKAAFNLILQIDTQKNSQNSYTKTSRCSLKKWLIYWFPQSQPKRVRGNEEKSAP